MLKKLIIEGDFNDEGWTSFGDYHRMYISGGDIPNHTGRWAIILSDDEREIILDGWHRFHCYVEKGIQIIPCVYPVRIMSACVPAKDIKEIIKL